MPKVSFSNTKIAFEYRSTAALKKARFLFQSFQQEQLVNFGASLAQLALKLHLPIKPFVKPLIYSHFCGGETLSECKQTAAKLAEYGMHIMLNYGTEGSKIERIFDKSLRTNLEAIEFAANNQNVNVICCKLSGLGRHYLFETKQKGITFSQEETVEWNKMVNRLTQLCHAAFRNNVMIYWDAEESWVQDTMDELIEGMMQKFNQQRAIVFNTYQMYRHVGMEKLKKAHERSIKKRYCLGVKLVRGAYVEKETEWAVKHAVANALNPDKQATDKMFDDGLRFCIENLDKLACCVASHNENSCLLAASLLNALPTQPTAEKFCFSQLYGMGDHISFNLANAGYHVYKYLPYGPVRDVIPYLIRRADENKSVQGQMNQELALIEDELKRRRKTI